MNVSKPWMKVIFIIVLLLIIVPLVLFALIRFAPPVKDQLGTADNSDSKSATTRERRAKRETRAVRRETTVVETEPEQSFEGVGAIVPNAPRSKQMSPYAPGTVPGDSGIVVQYAGSPDDPMSGPVPPPQDNPWGGAVLPPITPGNMRGIGGVRRIDPNDPFFQQDIPNPFAN